MDAGGLTTSEFARASAGLQRRYHRQPVGGALGKDPTRPRFVLSAVPVQMLGTPS